MPFAQFRVGFDYLPPRGWADFDAVGMGADLDLAASLGIDLLRVAMPWEFMAPTPERLSQIALGKLLALLDAAQGRGVSVMPAVLSGSPPYVSGDCPWVAPPALRTQVRHLRMLGERFRHHPAIVAWDLGASPDLAWGKPDEDAAWLWAHAVCSEWRRVVPHPLVVAFREGEGPWGSLGEALDFAGVSIDPMVPAQFARWPQDPLVPAFRAAQTARAAGRPAIVTAFDRFEGVSPSGTYHREALEALWKAGCAAVFADFAVVREGTRAHVADLAAFARPRRPVQPAPEHLTSFHAFAI